MNWETAIALIVALGGLEAIKYVIETIRNRRTDSRKQSAGATAMELDNGAKMVEMLQKQMSFLEQQLQERNLKVNALYNNNEKLIEQNTQLLISCGQKDVKIREAEYARCNVNECPRRQPPRIYSIKNKPKNNENK